MKRNQEMKINIPICLAGILFCLTLFSFYLCGDIYARYTSSGSGEDSARVAKFNITENGTYFSKDLLLETRPGSVENTICVENNSEVAVNYTITIKNKTQNIPYKFSINGSELQEKECSVTCYLEPNSKKDIKIVANWAKEGALQYMGMVDLITITVSAQQVD